MPKISKEFRDFLKRPLGRIVSLSQLKKIAEKKKIIAVGDISVFFLLSKGIRPFISIFDFKSLRKPVSEEIKSVIMEEYPLPVKVRNPPGEISEELFSITETLLKKGGAVYIDGEEDLTAIPFIFYAPPEKFAIIYGQPKEGIVLIDIKKVKNKIKEFLSDF